MLPVRKRSRLESFDYASGGAYFITLCVKNGLKRLGSVNVGATCGRPPEVVLSDLGCVVNREISHLDSVYSSLRVDHYVIMPNHIHMILFITPDSGRTQFAPTVSRAIKQFKGAVTKQVGEAIWQKGFHDHIIRDDHDYLMHLQYIDENPEKWIMGKDAYYS